MHNCIQTQNLKPGMVIVQVTQQNGPIKIRKAGLVTSIEMIQGLLEMGIQEVQIDPNQTVEIEASAPVIQNSATMQLLQSHSATVPKADNHLHDQFNRSLFLPSVQDIPSQWQFYTKRAAILAALVIVGLTLGFGAAYLPSVLALRSPLVLAEPVAEVSEKNSTTDNVEEPILANTPPATSQNPPENTPAQVEIQQPKLAQQEQEPETEQYEVKEPSKGVEVTQSRTAEKPQPASPELLKRFEKVIQQMEREERYASKNSEAESLANNNGPIVDLNEFPILNEQGEALVEQNLNEQKVSEQGELIAKQNMLTQVAKERIVQDVPRIDQLPDWLMKELPSMAFSAHMYASVPSERWVRVNGQNRGEGELIDNKVQILQIAPQHVILNYAGHEFSMQAMTDW